MPGLGTGIGESVIAVSAAPASSKSSFGKLDFESEAEPTEVGAGGGEADITWDSIDRPDLTRLQPCGSIQTSGQATCESCTTTLTDTRESGQSQCRSQDEQTCELVGMASSTSPGVDLNTATGNAVVTSPVPLTLHTPTTSLQNSERIDPLLVPTSPTGQSQEDSWPHIPSSPPPPLPLPPSHYRKLQQGEEVPATAILSTHPTSLDGGSSSSMSVSDALSPIHTQSSCNQHSSETPHSVPDLSGVGNGSANFNSGSIPNDSRNSPSIPSPAPEQSAVSMAIVSVVPPTVPSPVTAQSLSTVTVTTSTPSASMGEGVASTMTTAGGGGAWGSNRVKSWASVFKEPSTSGSRPAPSPRSIATPTSEEGAVSQERSPADSTCTAGGVTVVGCGNGANVSKGPSCSVQLVYLSGKSDWQVGYEKMIGIFYYKLSL